MSGPLITKLRRIKKCHPDAGNLNSGDAEAILEIINWVRSVAEDDCSNPPEEAVNVLNKIEAA